MLVKDESVNARHADMGAAEAERAKTLAWLQEQTKDSIYVSDDDNSPTNFERQLGTPLHHSVVETKLKKLNHHLFFEAHPFNNTKRIMLKELPNGTNRKIMVYEAGMIPEHSIMQAVIKETLHPDVVRSKFHIDRKDLTKHEIKPHEFNEDGTLRELGEVIWDDTVPQVGIERTKIPWAERVRGYRTMLMILVHAGAITRHQAEKEFGSANRAEWAGHMGKREKTTPW